MNDAHTDPDPESTVGNNASEGLEPGNFARFAWLPIPLLAAAIIAGRVAGFNESHRAETLTLVLSFCFYTLVSLSTLYLIGRKFLESGKPGLLLLECGVVLWGLAGTVGDAASHGDANMNVTIFNAAILLSGLCHLSGAILSLKPQRALRPTVLWLGAGFAFALGLLWLIAEAARAHWLPVFFVPGQGGTLVRHVVLISAIAAFILSSWLLLAQGTQRAPFTTWYAFALLLLAVGLFGIMIQLSLGSVVNWLSRTAQWLSGVYLLIASVSAMRETELPLFPLEKAATRKRYRYGVAIGIVLAATAMRMVFFPALGARFAFLTFFPAVALAALYGGLWPGLLATVLSALIADYFWIEPLGQFGIANPAEWVGLASFAASCAMMCAIIEAMHKARARLMFQQGHLEELVEDRTGELEQEIAERRKAESRLEADFAALMKIHELSGRLITPGQIEPLLQEIMDAAVFIINAQKGTLQLLERESLRIVAHYGHEQPFLDFFASAENRASVCGEATRQGERVIVPDIETSPLFAGTPSLDVLRQAGVRAVQSTPVTTRSGDLLGILTTQWTNPHQPDERDLWRIDLLSRQAADLIESAKANEEAAKSECRERERADELATLLDAIPTPVFIAHDPDCLHISGNSAADRLLQNPRGAEVSLSAPDGRKPVHFKAFKDGRELKTDELPAQRAAKGAEVRDFEFTLVFDDGSARQVTGYGTPLRDAEGRPRGAVHVLFDITERKETEDALGLHNEILVGINRILNAAMASETEEELGVVCLEVVEALTKSRIAFVGEIGSDGFLHDIAISNPGWDACNVLGGGGGRRPPGNFKIHGIYGRVLSDGLPLFTNDPARHPDAIGLPPAHPPIESFLGVPLFREGRVVGMVAVGNREGGYRTTEQGALEALAPAIVEAFQRKRAEDALRKSHDELEQRVEERTLELQKSEAIAQQQKMEIESYYHTAPIGLCVLDTDFRFVRINEHLAQINGLPASEHVGRAVREILPGLGDDIERIGQQVVETGEPMINVEMAGETAAKPGFRRTWMAAWYPLKDTGAKVVGISVVVQEVTEQRKLEEQLRQAQKMEAIGTLAGGIAHDFNNILAAILGFTEMAMDDVEDRPLVGKNLHNVIKSAMRARELVKQILTFSRKTPFERSALALTPVIKETVQLLRASIPKTIDIKFSLRTASDTVLASPVEVQQILMNLATNASLAMEKTGGTLEIGLADADFGPDVMDMAVGEYVKITVKDTGRGMSPEVMKRIFEPFYTTREVGKGSGMGLAVVYGIVKDLQGTITVESEEGMGSTFRVFFPRVETKSQEVSADRPEPVRGNGRILFVDDEEMLVEWGKTTLERLGYQVTAVTDSNEALRTFAAGPQEFDLVITDHAMPQMAGAQLSQELLRIRDDIPIILCTGHSETVSPERAKEIGIREYLMKPLARHELAEAVRRVLDARDAT